MIISVVSLYNTIAEVMVLVLGSVQHQHAIHIAGYYKLQMHSA